MIRIRQRGKTQVKCKDCNKEFIKRNDTLKEWQGRCKRCAMKYKANLPETIKKMSELAKIQVLKQGGIPNAVKFIKGIHSGENHSGWRGGVTHERTKIRNCEQYREWRNLVFRRDEFICCHCGVKGGQLNADHYPKTFSKIVNDNGIKKLEDALKCDELWDLGNGRTLCVPCHKETDSYKKHPIRNNWDITQ